MSEYLLQEVLRGRFALIDGDLDSVIDDYRDEQTNLDLDLFEEIHIHIHTHIINSTGPGNVMARSSNSQRFNGLVKFNNENGLVIKCRCGKCWEIRCALYMNERTILEDFIARMNSMHISGNRYLGDPFSNTVATNINDLEPPASRSTKTRQKREVEIIPPEQPKPEEEKEIMGPTDYMEL
mgnify:CR=1 FL=1